MGEEKEPNESTEIEGSNNCIESKGQTEGELGLPQVDGKSYKHDKSPTDTKVGDPLNYEIYIQPITKHYMIIYIGNSGLEYTPKSNPYDGYFFLQDYMPDVYVGDFEGEISSKTIIKYASIYAGALLTFLEYLLKYDKYANYTKIMGTTNPTNSRFRKKLLGDAYNETIDDKVPEDVDYEIDISKIINNRDLMTKLFKIRERTLRSGYTMSVANNPHNQSNNLNK